MLEWTAGCIDNIHWRQLPLTTSTAFRPAFRWRGFPPVTSPARLKLTNTDTNTEKAGGDSRLQLQLYISQNCLGFYRLPILLSKTIPMTSWKLYTSVLVLSTHRRSN